MFDVIFISYNEPNAEDNWDVLVDKVPYAKRVEGVKGIDKAHYQAYLKSRSDMFYVVDGDGEVSDDFDFSFKPEKDKRRFTHIWYSHNPVNGLEYGYGGIKLFPSEIFQKRFKPMVTDFTMTISEGIIVVEKVSCITRFDTSPFNTWKAAFRECSKLSLVIGNSDNDFRLEKWCTVGDGEFGKFSILGAQDGKEYGVKNSNNSDALKLINDWDWLYSRFLEQVN